MPRRRLRLRRSERDGCDPPDRAAQAGAARGQDRRPHRARAHDRRLERPGVAGRLPEAGAEGCDSDPVAVGLRRVPAPAPLPDDGEVRPAVELRPIVEAAAVSRSYGSPLAIDDIDFALRPGELALLVGPSGAGKTTLLRLINREIRPTSGEI